MANNIETKRHSYSHVLAAAVLEMFPEAKLGIGPAIDNGFYYDFDLPRTLIPEDLPLLEKAMQQLIKQGSNFEKSEVPVEEALEEAKKNGQVYKAELIKDLTTKGEKLVSFYRVDGFVDLCAGPHVDSLKELDPKAFKLTSIAGAYWKGSEKNKMLQRIYGFAFNTPEELNNYTEMMEEAKKRDHRKLGKELEYFDFSDEVGAGLPLWLPKGYFVKRMLEDYMLETEKRYGYQHIQTPVLTHEKLYIKSGHLSHYKADMYNPIDIDGENYYLKPMNCPHHHMVFETKMRSYKELPIRFAEFGLVHRYERSGVLSGLIRARCFTQNDAHIYCTKSQLKDELKRTMDLLKEVYAKFEIADWWFRLSLPDFKDSEKFGDIKNKSLWDESSAAVREALEESGEEYVEGIGEAAFYGPKIDIQIKNVQGKEDTIATIQVDFYMPEKFNLEYIDESGERQHPVVIHRAIMGSFERFFSFLLEKTAGALPTWLAPIQVRFLPIADRHIKHCEKDAEKLREAGVRVEIDDSKESVGKKIRNAEIAKIPFMLVVGDKEIESNKPAVRSYADGDLGQITLEELIKKVG